jgi:glutaredoxin-related protein
MVALIIISFSWLFTFSARDCDSLQIVLLVTSKYKSACPDLDSQGFSRLQAGLSFAGSGDNVSVRIKQLLESAPVILFMKGSPAQPRCGFSRRVVDALNKNKVVFKHFDILEVSHCLCLRTSQWKRSLYVIWALITSTRRDNADTSCFWNVHVQDEEIRQGLKAYSDWPTYPQLYANAELLGGCDIVEELDHRGELAGAIKEAMEGSTWTTSFASALPCYLSGDKDFLAVHILVMFGLHPSKMLPMWLHVPWGVYLCTAVALDENVPRGIVRALTKNYTSRSNSPKS